MPRALGLSLHPKKHQLPMDLSVENTLIVSHSPELLSGHEDVLLCPLLWKVTGGSKDGVCQGPEVGGGNTYSLDCGAVNIHSVFLPWRAAYRPSHGLGLGHGTCFAQRDIKDMT